MPTKSLSIIVPALNEEGDLENTIKTVTTSIEENPSISDYEIILIDDGSQDRTGSIADQLAENNPLIRSFHHSCPMGLGYCYREGIKVSTKEFIGWAPGKNSIPQETFIRMLNAIGEADIVLVYILSETRSYFRRVLSRVFTIGLNVLFGLHIKYFNGPCIYKSSQLKNTKMTTNGFAFMAEINIRMLKAGATYVEVGLNNRDRTQGSSKAFVFRNFLRVVNLVTKLFWEIEVKNRFKHEETSDLCLHDTKMK